MEYDQKRLCRLLAQLRKRFRGKHEVNRFPGIMKACSRTLESWNITLYAFIWLMANENVQICEFIKVIC
jgi:hypothetical protein